MERLTFVVPEGKSGYISIEHDGKEYTIRYDEEGIHVFCLKGLTVQMTDIFRNPPRWLIIK